jgi:hypothetical protein
VTIGCVNGGEAINVVTSKTPCTPPIGQSDTLDEVAFDQAAPGLVVMPKSCRDLVTYFARYAATRRGDTARHAALQRQLSDANRKVAALIAAVESGVAAADLTAALRQRTAERDELRAHLERAERPHVMSAVQISELVEELGGLSAVLGAATGAERAQVYASLGLRLDYDPHLRRVKATADLSRVAGCVRGGT